MYVKPGPHPDHPDDATKTRAVRIPHTFELLPAAGREVPDNSFWRRRLAHGDVVEASPQAPKIAAPEAAPTPGAPAPETHA